MSEAIMSMSDCLLYNANSIRFRLVSMPDQFKKQQATGKATDVLTSDRDSGLARAGNDTSWQLIVEAVLTTCGQTEMCNS